MAEHYHHTQFPQRTGFGLLRWSWCFVIFGQMCTVGVVSAQPPVREKSAVSNRPAASPAADDRVDVDSGLPPGFVPPHDPPPTMLIEQNLLTSAEREKIARELNKTYGSRTRNGDLRTPEARDGVRMGIRYRLNELTISKNSRELAKYRKKLYGDLQQAGKSAGFKPEQMRNFRSELLQMIVEECEPLFANNTYVRINAAVLLGEINLMEPDSGTNTPAEPFPPAAKLLCKVITDPEQPEAVKIACVLSLIRIVRQGNPNSEQKREVATAVISELKRTDTHFGYQCRLAEVLGSIDINLDLDRLPYIFNMLNSILNDRDRNIRVRVEAAWALARHPLPAEVKIPQLMSDLAALGLDVAQQHADNSAALHWKRTATVLYLTFRSIDKSDQESSRQREGGFLNNPATANGANEVYKQLLPIFKPIMKGDQVAPEEIQALEKWLKGRDPKPTNAARR